MLADVLVARGLRRLVRSGDAVGRMDAYKLVDVSRLTKHHPVPLAGDLDVQQVGDGSLVLDVPLLLQCRGELVVR